MSHTRLKRTEKRKERKKEQKYQQLNFELREQMEGYTVKEIPTVMDCFGRRVKRMRRTLRNCLVTGKNWKEQQGECKKSALWESKTITSGPPSL